MTGTKVVKPEDWRYPQYRKYVNDRSYFEIESPEKITEVQRIGSHYTMHVIEVKTMPDRNLVLDLLNDEIQYSRIESGEFQKFMDECKNKYTFREW